MEARECFWFQLTCIIRGVLNFRVNLIIFLKLLRVLEINKPVKGWNVLMYLTRSVYVQYSTIHNR